MATTQRTIELTTADGHRLAADLAIPDQARGSLVVCHPHPRYGGNRSNPVVEAIFAGAVHHGLAAIRFDFRREHGGGIAERADVAAAIDEITRHTPGPVALAGYSFGAVVALSTADERIGAVAAVAPPLAMMQVEPPSVPTLVLAPRHDQIADVDTAASIVADWPVATFELVESADHFLTGHTGRVADTVLSWLATVGF